MRFESVIAYALGLTVSALALLAYAEYVHSPSFPDGYVTELERAQRKLALVFIGFSIVVGGWFVYLGWAASRRRRRRLLVVLSLYFVLSACVLILDYSFRSLLDSGIGG